MATPATLGQLSEPANETVQLADYRRRDAQCRAEWTYVDSITCRGYRAVTDKALRVLPGAGQRKIVEA